MKKFYILYLTAFLFSFTLFAQDEYKTGFEKAPKERLEKLKPFDETTIKGELKSSIDMSADFPPVGDQGSQNSCVAWAVAYVISYYHHSSYTSYYTSTGEIDCSTIYSPSFIYNPLNFCTNLAITYPDALEFVYNKGVVDLCEMPYSKIDYCTKPTKEQYEKASVNKIKEFYAAYETISTKLLKEKMNEGYPILVGVIVDKTFLTKYKTASVSYIWSGYSDNTPFGHAMIIVGYDDDKKAFKVMNSWGTTWGENGFIWIAYDFAPDCIIEAYYIEK